MVNAIGRRTLVTLNPDRALICEYCEERLPATPVYRDPFVPRRSLVSQGGFVLPAGQYAQAAGVDAHPWAPSAGLLIELLPGLFGFLGIGYLWAGETLLGISLLLGYWVFWTLVAVATFLPSGLLLCFFPFLILLYFVAPVVSALALQRRLRARQSLVVEPAAPYASYPY